MKTIRRGIGIIAIASSLGILGLGSAAHAAPGDNGNGVGGCVDNLHGNASNPRPSGHGVLPSQSPGPFVNTGPNEPPRNDRVRGLSTGEAVQLLHAAGFGGREAIEIFCLFP